jgi:hypothetical protein
MFYECVADVVHHVEEETNEYELQRLKIIAANQQMFRSLGLPGTLNGDSSNKVLSFSQVSAVICYSVNYLLVQ